MPLERRASRRDVLCGIAGGAVAYPMARLTLNFSSKLMESAGVPLDRVLLSTNYAWLVQTISEIHCGLLRVASKGLLIFLMVVAGPTLEEWAFRGVIYDYQKRYIGGGGRVITSAVLFGAMHLNYSLGITSMPYFLVATISGVVYACLREGTRSWHAPAVAHGVSNACVIAFETLR